MLHLEKREYVLIRCVQINSIIINNKKVVYYSKEDIN